MWSPFQPIKSLQIPKSCEKMWDFMKKYFHLNSSAVYNISTKANLIILLHNAPDNNIKTKS